MEWPGWLKCSKIGEDQLTVVYLSLWGGHAKNGFKGRASQRIWCVKGGGVTKKIAFQFCSDSICNNANVGA